MSRTSLHDFVARVLADDRILFADLKRLQRDVLPERITSREEAEILLFLDSVIHRTDREWTAYLTATVRDFAIWGLHPAGSVDRDKAAWLSGALACADQTKTARSILREIVHEACNIDDDARLELGVGAGGAVRGPRARQNPRLPSRPDVAPLCAPGGGPGPSDRLEPTAAQE